MLFIVAFYNGDRTNQKVSMAYSITANNCPRCGGESMIVRVSLYRGDIFQCKSCLVPHPTKEEKTPLLWFWESDRLWEDLEQPEGEGKPELVKVILAIDPDRII